MTTPERTIKVRERDFKDSRLRCLLLTTEARDKVADFLNSLTAPHAQVTVMERLGAWLLVVRGFSFSAQ